MTVFTNSVLVGSGGGGVSASTTRRDRDENF